jgi:hypothetical protein
VEPAKLRRAEGGCPVIRFDGKRVILREADQGISRFVSRPTNGLRRGCDCLKHGLDRFLAIEVSIRVRRRAFRVRNFHRLPPEAWMLVQPDGC